LYTSVLLAVVVLVGTVPFGHTTAAGQVIVLPGVASLDKCNVNPKAPVGTLVIENAKVALPVKVAVTKFPFDNASVGAVEVLPNT
jgi:hypothetical protein